MRWYLKKSNWQRTANFTLTCSAIFCLLEFIILMTFKDDPTIPGFQGIHSNQAFQAFMESRFFISRNYSFVTFCCGICISLWSGILPWMDVTLWYVLVIFLPFLIFYDLNLRRLNVTIMEKKAAAEALLNPTSLIAPMEVSEDAPIQASVYPHIIHDSHKPL